MMNRKKRLAGWLVISLLYLSQDAFSMFGKSCPVRAFFSQPIPMRLADLPQNADENAVRNVGISVFGESEFPAEFIDYLKDKRSVKIGKKMSAENQKLARVKANRVATALAILQDSRAKVETIQLVELAANLIRHIPTEHGADFTSLFRRFQQICFDFPTANAPGALRAAQIYLDVVANSKVGKAMMAERNQQEVFVFMRDYIFHANGISKFLRNLEDRDIANLQKMTVDHLEDLLVRARLPIGDSNSISPRHVGQMLGQSLDWHRMIGDPEFFDELKELVPSFYRQLHGELGAWITRNGGFEIADLGDPEYQAIERGLAAFVRALGRNFPGDPSQ